MAIFKRKISSLLLLITLVSYCSNDVTLPISEDDFPRIKSIISQQI